MIILGILLFCKGCGLLVIQSCSEEAASGGVYDFIMSNVAYAFLAATHQNLGIINIPK